MEHYFRSSFLPPFLAVAMMLLLCGLLPAEVLYVVNSQSRTLSRIDTITEEINNNFSTLGNVPNKIVVDNAHIWAVNSGDNAVQKISPVSGETLATILVAPGSNPWDAVKQGDFLYVSGLFSGKVYKVDTLSGSVVASVNVGIAPEGMQVLENRLYVCNAGDYADNYAGSSVSVIDLDSFSVITTIPVSANPQYIKSWHGLLHVSCTGNWSDVAGKIMIIDPEINAVIHTINLGGTLGCLWVANDEVAYVGDSNGAYLFSYNPIDFSVLHGVNNPLANGGSEVVGNAGLIAVLSPNWGANGTVRLLHPDLTPWKQFTVAMMPTDLKLGYAASAHADETMPAATVAAYPNPVLPGQKLQFSSQKTLLGRVDIFNLKGQKVLSKPVDGQDSSIATGQLAAGIYFYRLMGEGMNHTGKFVVTR